MYRSCLLSTLSFPKVGLSFLLFLVVFRSLPRVSLSFNFFSHSFKELDSEESCFQTRVFLLHPKILLSNLCLWISWQRLIVTYRLLSLAVPNITCYSYCLSCIDLIAACFWQSLRRHWFFRRSANVSCTEARFGFRFSLCFEFLAVPSAWLSLPDYDKSLSVREFRIDQLGFKSVFLRGEYMKFEAAVMPLWSDIVRNSWFRFCIAALPSSLILLFVFLAVDEVPKINVLFPLTRVFHQYTEVFCLLVLQPAVFSLLSFARFSFPRNSGVCYPVPEGSGATLLIVRCIFPWILRRAFSSWSINAGVSTVFTVFRSVWFRRIWFCYPGKPGASVSVCFGLLSSFPVSEDSGGFLCELSSLFSESHDHLIWLALLLPLFRLSYLLG